MLKHFQQNVTFYLYFEELNEYGSRVEPKIVNPTCSFYVALRLLPMVRNVLQI